MENRWLLAIQQTDVRIQNSLSDPPAKGASALDTGFKWIPLAALLIADLLGLKTKNKFKQHVLCVVVAEAILNVTMLPIKKVVNRERPNGDGKSFPSGHAATGFLSSQILYEELKENYPALSYSGYVVSCV